MKILVFGGSFDPVHKGHVAMLKKALEHLKPDVAHIVPAYQSPFKAKSPTPFKLRMQMAKAAFAPLGKNLIFDDYGPSHHCRSQPQLPIDSNSSPKWIRYLF